MVRRRGAGTRPESLSTRPRGRRAGAARVVSISSPSIRPSLSASLMRAGPSVFTVNTLPASHPSGEVGLIIVSADSARLVLMHVRNSSGSSARQRSILGSQQSAARSGIFRRPPAPDERPEAGIEVTGLQAARLLSRWIRSGQACEFPARGCSFICHFLKVTSGRRNMSPSCAFGRCLSE